MTQPIARDAMYRRRGFDGDIIELYVEGLRQLEQARAIIEARNPDGRINSARIRAEEARAAAAPVRF